MNTRLRSSLLAATLILGTSMAAYSEGQPAASDPAARAKTSDSDQSTAGVAKANKAAPKTTGSGTVRDQANSPAMDPKKSLDDPKQYGKPDKH